MAQIIVVEDDVYMREELIDVLEKAGYDAVPLLDFENAVSQIMSLSPDLILLDINLPFHSGFEVCKEIKAKRLGTVPLEGSDCRLNGNPTLPLQKHGVRPRCPFFDAPLFKGLRVWAKPTNTFVCTI